MTPTDQHTESPGTPSGRRLGRPEGSGQGVVAMDFRILGQFEVVGTTGVLDLRGAKRRGLLACLALHAGQPLSTDRLVDELWGDGGSDGAARTVQTYVSQLRKLLRDQGASLRTLPGGYVLEIEPAEVDAYRFERAVTTAGAEPDPARRLAVLDGALELWRGRPLGEFMGAEWADREARRLEALHVHMLQRRYDTLLDLDRAGEAVAGLEPLVSAHPLDERLWAQLMLALYRSGRQADALGAYGRLRHHLGHELGIEPSRELARLEEAILLHDADLDCQHARSASPSGPATFPSGVVTFLCSDIVGSTALWEEDADAMAKAVARQDALIGAAVLDNGGVVVKSTGDGLVAAFDDATSGVSAAADVQRALSTEGWAVPITTRTGLHTGPGHPEQGDYLGPTVNRAARIAGAAHPGQILISTTTAALLKGWTLRDLGEHHLRGVAPMRLHQVVVSGVPSEFPPLATALLAVDLPSPNTTFVGRATDVEAVVRLVDGHRLVTLTGVGGCGKTRLAIEAAGRLAGRFPDGVRFADLATVTDSTQVADVVVRTLSLADDPTGTDPLARLSSYLADRAVLCVLDNCEHVLDACATLSEAILARPGRTCLLATSREPLGVIGEQAYVVPSLDFDTDAVRLFADRAAEARADFRVDDTQRVTVAQICKRLDGMPLAIELAAARIAYLSATQLLGRLDDRFRLLTSGRRRVERHKTLAATLDWSHDLLEPNDRVALRRLAVFPASFSLEAAEAVARIDDAIESLGSLVAKSLVQVVDDGEQLRYRLLETVRIYAEDKLVDAGEAEECRARHRDWVLDWLESIPFEERWLGDVDFLTGEVPFWAPGPRTAAVVRRPPPGGSRSRPTVADHLRPKRSVSGCTGARRSARWRPGWAGRRRR